MRRLTIGVAACTEVMGLLVTMAWADGELQDEEIAGIRSAADTLNLSQELRDRLEGYIEEAPLPSDLSLDTLSKRDAEFAYVAAAWLARVDDSVEEEEWDLLAEIGEVFKMASWSCSRRSRTPSRTKRSSSPSSELTWARGPIRWDRARPLEPGSLFEHAGDRDPAGVFVHHADHCG
ncbi:MAG: TerB family tellurite resistance protein [Deltaproteobacteria bacterium]|nr:TerB family tellurite resistance protein [Deltaproteobacteria bacterium]